MRVVGGWVEEHFPTLTAVVAVCMVVASSGALYLAYRQAQGAHRLCETIELIVRTNDARLDASPTYQGRPLALAQAHEANARTLRLLNCGGLP